MDKTPLLYDCAVCSPHLSTGQNKAARAGEPPPLKGFSADFALA
jgi:hypothetical protein